MSFRWQAKDVLLHQFDGALQVLKASCFGAIMGAGDERLNILLMFGQEGVDVFEVDYLRALGLWEHKVGKDDQADPAVEWHPISPQVSD